MYLRNWKEPKCLFCTANSTTKLVLLKCCHLICHTLGSCVQTQRLEQLGLVKVQYEISRSENDARII